jgi:hypothetical protein
MEFARSRNAGMLWPPPGESRLLLKKSLVGEPFRSKGPNNGAKEMDTRKLAVKRRQIPHAFGGDNVGSLRSTKLASIGSRAELIRGPIKSLPSRKYDIATLMAIGKNGGLDSVVTKFSSHSIESKISQSSLGYPYLETLIPVTSPT